MVCCILSWSNQANNIWVSTGSFETLTNELGASQAVCFLTQLLSFLFLTLLQDPLLNQGGMQAWPRLPFRKHVITWRYVLSKSPHVSKTRPWSFRLKFALKIQPILEQHREALYNNRLSEPVFISQATHPWTSAFKDYKCLNNGCSGHYYMVLLDINATCNVINHATLISRLKDCSSPVRLKEKCLGHVIHLFNCADNMRHTSIWSVLRSVLFSLYRLPLGHIICHHNISFHCSIKAVYSYIYPLNLLNSAHCSSYWADCWFMQQRFDKAEVLF